MQEVLVRFCVVNGKKNGCCYRSSAFVMWLNQFVLNHDLEKASVLEEYVSYETGHICRAVYPAFVDSQGSTLREAFIDWLQTDAQKGITQAQAYVKTYGDRDCTVYALVDWLNQSVLEESDDKAYVSEKQVPIGVIEKLPVIDF